MPIDHSLSILRADAPPAGLVAVAVVTLAEAIHQQFDMPGETGRLLWAVVRRSPDAGWSTAATEAIGEIASADLAALVIHEAQSPSVGIAVFHRALEVLSGSAAAAHVTDHLLLAIAERSRGRLVFPASQMIRSVCEHRRVRPETVTFIVESWSRRLDAESRHCILDLVDHVPGETAQSVVEAALSDGQPAIRATAAAKISELYGREHGLAVVGRALRTEQDVRIIAALVSAYGELLAKAPTSAAKELAS